MIGAVVMHCKCIRLTDLNLVYERENAIKKEMKTMNVREGLARQS